MKQLAGRVIVSFLNSKYDDENLSQNVADQKMYVDLILVNIPINLNLNCQLFIFIFPGYVISCHFCKPFYNRSYFQPQGKTSEGNVKLSRL